MLTIRSLWISKWTTSAMAPTSKLTFITTSTMGRTNTLSAFFNDVSYVSPKVPSLYTALTTGSNATDVAIYGTDTNAFVLDKDEIVEIVMNNDDGGKHPFHLHGHNFQVVVRSDDDAGHYDPNNHTAFPAKPMRRDTLMVRPNGNFVIRFKADNPGMIYHPP